MRPATLAASVAPVLTGTAIAINQGGARWWAGAGALILAIAIQLGVNFANDYSDFVRGADAKRVGPVRAASSGVVPPEHVRWAAIAAFGVAALVGLALSIAIDVRLVLVGVACLLAGWLYTGGPRPYGYLGLGEVFVFVFFGLVATAGTVYLETGRISRLTWLMAFAMGCFASAILVLNNLRDIETDAAAGKRTLATRIGRNATRRLLAVLATAAILGPAAGLAKSYPPILITLLVIPIALSAGNVAWHTTDAPSLVQALKRMAVAELAYALLFALAMVL